MAKWQANETDPAEHGNNSADFWSTDQERGITPYRNWPILLAAMLAVLVALLILFLL